MSEQGLKGQSLMFSLQSHHLLSRETSHPIPLRSFSRSPFYCQLLLSGKSLILAFVFGILFLSGCANTAKVETDDGRTVQIVMRFRGPVDVSRYRYYVALSGITPPAVPSIPPAKYLPTPGRTYDDTHPDFQNNTSAILQYYTYFFTTWSDYVVVDQAGIQLFKSNSTGFTASKVNDHFNYLASFAFGGSFVVSESTLTIRFPMASLSAASASQLHYSIFTSEPTDSPSTEAGTVRDILQDAQLLELTINVEKNARIGPFFDSEDTSLSAIDLVEWSVDIL